MVRVEWHVLILKSDCNMDCNNRQPQGQGNKRQGQGVKIRSTIKIRMQYIL